MAVRILDESEWDKNEKTGVTRKTGEVVAILKKSIINSCAGHFVPSTSLQGETVLQFKPMDTRLPRILINKSDLTDAQVTNIETNMQHNTIYQGWLLVRLECPCSTERSQSGEINFVTKISRNNRLARRKFHSKWNIIENSWKWIRTKYPDGSRFSQLWY